MLAAESGSYSVAIGDLGVAVSQWTYADDSVRRLDVVDFNGQNREFPAFGGNALLAYGPGDVLYMTQQGTSVEELAVVTVALGPDGATEVRRERENVLADVPTAGICPNPPDFEPSVLPAGFTKDLVAGQGGHTTIQPDGQIAPIEPVNPDVYHYAGEPGTFINITAGTIPALTATNTEQITVLDSPATVGEIEDGYIAELHTTCGTDTFVAAGISRADFETFLTGLQPG